MGTTSSKSMMRWLGEVFSGKSHDERKKFFHGENRTVFPEMGGQGVEKNPPPPSDAKGELKDMSSFEDSQRREGAFDSKDRGVQTVQLKQITGSVGRYQDFDDQFKFKSPPSERFNSILEAMRSGKTLPPVKLYQIKDEYYVLDGNHRVAAANMLRHDEILATIIEFIPSSESLDNVLYRERIAFCERTGLPRSILLTELGQYSHLTRQIQEHYLYLRNENPEITFAGAARDWYKTIYKPFCTIIERGRIAESFSDRTIADLYLYISVGHWKKGSHAKYGIGVGKLIPKTMEEFRTQMASLNETDYPEMKQEIITFILVEVEGKQERDVLGRLFALDGVLEVHSVHGDIDILMKVELSRDLLSSDAKIIDDFVHMVRQLEGVVKTQTLIPGVSKIKAV